MLCHCRRR